MIVISSGKIRRRDKRIWFVVLGVFAAVFLFTFLSKYHGAMEEEAEAASLANFDPGYIISDWQMGNYASMSEAEIQSFLSGKGKCRDTNVGKANNYPSLKYHIKDGHFVCLAEELFGDGETIGEGDTAAHIIWQAAQDYKINPQVLIVLLQKEQGLITDSWPNNVQYRSATGYGCPDTAACSSKYYGFKNQIRNAASMFRTVLDGGWTNFPLGNNYVQYNPNAACGGSIVNIRSLATSALYRYTPYQPNAGALAAGYGTASCGAYGNRNFYLYFEDWFGGIINSSSPIPESSDIIGGEYIIESKLGDGLVLDVLGGSDSNGANVQVYKSNNSMAQRWIIEKNDDNTYSVKSVISNKSLDVEAGKKTDGSNIQIYASNNSCAQKWSIVSDNDGAYSIYSVCSGKVLDIEGGKGKNGVNVQLYVSNQQPAQKWILKPVKTIKDGSYTIGSKLAEGIAMDVDENKSVHIKKESDTLSQQWEIKYGDDGYYTITNASTKEALDISDSKGMSNFTRTIVGEAKDTCSQRWQILSNEDKSYTIYSKCAKYVLDINGGMTADGTIIQMFESNNSNAQKWIIKSLEATLDGDYYIASALNTNAVVDIAGGTAGANNGTNIQIYVRNNSSAQQWQLKKNEDETYTVINRVTNKVLDVFGGQMISGTNIQLYGGNNSCAQKWKIVDNEDGTYTFHSCCSSGKVLDLWGGISGNGTNIQLYSANKSLAQKWKLIK